MDASAKQQVIDRIKQANNILVTVSTNPSVDQLAACIGLTLLLNRMDKHATAVFSGQVPSTLEFLQPDQTIVPNTDSLRDFIISLDKNKADKLRYKVEDKVVKIYITPYKTSLTENDMVYSQGDYNVEVVIALGIADKTHIDAAITAHGKILHDAIVIAVNSGTAKVQPLGQINWQEPAASSLSEMVVSISEAFGAGLIDNQMATAFLTGIVAETKRFSNVKTTPKVMTMSAQLMAAGANQQLIVSKLEPPPPPVQKYVPGQAPSKPVYQGKPEATPQDGTLKVRQAGAGNPSEVEIKPDEIHIDAQGNLKTSVDVIAQKQLEESQQPSAPTTSIMPSPAYMGPPAVSAPVSATVPAEASTQTDAPHTLLNPDKQSEITGSQFTANTQPEWSYHEGSTSYDPLSGVPPTQAQETQPLTASTRTVQPLDAARNAVQEALSSTTPTTPAMPAFTDSNFASESIVTSQPPAEMSQNSSKPAPPPFPPPLSPAQGAVIPNPTSVKQS